MSAVRFRVKGTALYVEQFRAEASLPVPVGNTPGISAYTTTGWGTRSNRWRAPSLGPNAALDYSAPRLRSQSRDLVRKNALAASAIDRIVSNVVGTGIKPQTKDQKAQALWLAWTDESAADGQLDFFGQQAQIMRAVVEAGECFVRLRVRRPEDGLSVPLQLEILEPEFVPHERNVAASPPRQGENGTIIPAVGEIRQGIEFHPILRAKRVAYWVHPSHPDDNVATPVPGGPVRVPASEILHVFLPGRPGQVRGEPWLARVLDRLTDVESYDKAELVRKKTSAMMVGFIRRNVPDGAGLSLEEMQEMWGSGTTSEPTTINAGVGEVVLEPGTMQMLLPGEDVEFTDPKDVGGQYEVFLKAQHRAIAAALGLLYEQLTGDYSQVNDRTWRAAATEFRRRCELWQHHLMVYQFCRPVWQRWGDLAVLSGALGKRFDPRTAVPWIPQAWPYINPVQDVEAKRAEIRAGFTTRSMVVSEQGEDAAVIDAGQQADNERADTAGLVYESDGRVALSKGSLGASTGQVEAPINPTAPQPEPAPADKRRAARAEARAEAKLDAVVGAMTSVAGAVAAMAGREPPPPPAPPLPPVINVEVKPPPEGRSRVKVLAHDKDGRVLEFEKTPIND